MTAESKIRCMMLELDCNKSILQVKQNTHLSHRFVITFLRDYDLYHVQFALSTLHDKSTLQRLQTNRPHPNQTLTYLHVPSQCQLNSLHNQYLAHI